MKFNPSIRQKIFKDGLTVLTVIILLLAADGNGLASLLLLDSLGAEHSSRVLRGGEIVQGRQETGWRATVEQDDEIAGTVHQSIDYVETIIDSAGGTLDFIIERVEPAGDAVKYETLAAFVNPDTFEVGKYDHFEVVFYLEWNSTFDGKPVIYIDSQGQNLEKTAKVWGTLIPFPIPVDPGDHVHIRITWGTEGPVSNRIYFNGIEAEKYLFREDDSELSSRGSSLSDFLPSNTTLMVGNSLQSPLSGTILYGVSLYNEVLDASAPFGFGRPEISGVTHDTFSVAGYSGKLVVGDISTVTLRAEPGGTATFDFGPVKNHEMSENPNTPGVYTGTHAVLYGEDVEDDQVVGHFASAYDVQAEPATAQKLVTVDTKTYMNVKTSNDLLPADEDSRAGITVVAKDANGKAVKDQQLKMTLSTTDEYTGTVGGGSFEDLVGGSIEVNWGGVTDSFGEVTAQYLSGFAAKTILVSGKDMVTGDVAVGWVRSYIDGTVDIVVAEPRAGALSVSGTMDVSLSREWLTADGQSRSRITAVVKDASGNPTSGHSVRFTLLGKNGEIRIVQGKTDSRGRAIADYIAGTVMGQVQVEIRDLTSGMVVLVPIKLRPDAPAEIILAADPAEVVTGGESTVSAKVTDANGNPNQNVDVIYNILVGNGELSSPSVGTDEMGNAPVTLIASDTPGLVTVGGTVISREPTAEEISAAEGALFLYGLGEDPGLLEVAEWLAEPGDEVVEGQGLVVLEDRADITYTVVAPRDGTVSTFVAEERDRVEYGDTLGYILPLAE